MPCTLPLPVSGVLLLVTSWRYDQMAQEPWACTAAMAASGAFCLWVSLHRGAEKRVWVPRAHGVLSAAFLLCAVGYALQQYQVRWVCVGLQYCSLLQGDCRLSELLVHKPRLVPPPLLYAGHTIAYHGS